MENLQIAFLIALAIMGIITTSFIVFGTVWDCLTDTWEKVRIVKIGCCSVGLLVFTMAFLKMLDFAIYSI